MSKIKLMQWLEGSRQRKTKHHISHSLSPIVSALTGELVISLALYQGLRMAEEKSEWMLDERD